MSKRVSASEAKTKFGSIVNWTLESNDDVIVESYGKPKVVIMTFESYQKILDLREQVRRQEALATLEALREQVLARNQDLDEAEAESVADRFSRDVIDDLAKEKKIKYQGK